MKISGSIRFKAALLASCATLGIAGAAQAQTVAPDAPQTTSASTEDPTAKSEGLSDIVVVAQKRAQNVQDVPIAITAIEGAQLARQGIVTTEDLKTSFSGVNIRTGGVAFQPSIRGIGTGTVNVENPVAFYIDGVYYANQSDARRDLTDIEQVAVLKGPQGTLFGRNATAGVIQLTTRAPSHQFGGDASVSIDQYATVRSTAYLTGPLSQSLAFSLAGAFTTQAEGWGRNFTTGNDIYKIAHNAMVRGKLLFEPDDRTNATLIADYMDRKDNLGIYYRSFPGTGFAASLNYRRPTSVYDSYNGDESRNLFRGGGASLTINHDLGFARLQSISAYRQLRSGYISDADSTPALVFRLDTTKNNAKSFSQEVQLTSQSDSKVNWAAGIFYFYYRNALEPVDRQFGGAFAPAATSVVRRDIYSNEVTNSVAPFGQVDFEVLPRTRLTLGARWTYEQRVLNGITQGVLKNGTFVPAILPPIVDAKLTAKKPTWRIALDHKFSDTTLAYASYNRGFKSGGFNITNLANPSYQPERLDAYEVGLKTEVLDRRLRLNTAGFYYKYQNLQVLQLINGANTITNGARAELYGLDVDLEASITSEFKISGGFELLHTEFTSYPNAAISTPLPAGGLSIVLGNATGNRLPAAQNFTGNISGTYTRQTSVGEIVLNGTWNHNSKYFFESDNFTFQNPYDIVNLSANLTPTDSALTIGVFVRNLLDRKVAAQASAFGGIGYVTTYDNPPRVYGALARVKF